LTPTPGAAILCGGRGERLKPLTNDLQKAMLPVGPKSLPLLTYILSLLKHHGITEIALLGGYRAEDIKRHFGDGSRHGVELTYSEDPEGLKGSLNALAHALRESSLGESKDLLVYYGDMLLDLEIPKLLATHRKASAQATLVLGSGYSLPVGVAEVKGEYVTSFSEKPKMDLSVTTGMMVLGSEALALARETAGPKKTDIMSHLIPRLLQKGAKVAAFYTSKEWFDVGTFSSYERLNEELARHPWPYPI
jgi:mannose-1-phosphate guanylyltransferase